MVQEISATFRVVFDTVEDAIEFIEKFEKEVGNFSNNFEVNTTKDILIKENSSSVDMNFYLENSVKFVKGYGATREEPGEPDYLEGYIDDENIVENLFDKIAKNLGYRNFDYEIEDLEVKMDSEEKLIDERDF